MSRFKRGTYSLLLVLVLALPLGWFADDILAGTGFEWLGSTFVLVIVCLTLSELIVNWVFGRPKVAEPQEDSSFLGDAGR